MHICHFNNMDNYFLFHKSCAQATEWDWKIHKRFTTDKAIHNWKYYICNNRNKLLLIDTNTHRFLKATQLLTDLVMKLTEWFHSNDRKLRNIWFFNWLIAVQLIFAWILFNKILKNLSPAFISQINTISFCPHNILN